MIKINLATLKQSGLSSGAKGGAATSGSLLKGINLDQLKEFPLRKIGLPVVVALVANGLLNNYKEEELHKLDVFLSKLSSETAKLQTELTQYKRYDSVKKTMDEDEVTIKTKLEIIQKLILNRAEPLQLGRSVSSAIPKEVWLSEFKLDSTSISFKGSSLGFSQISDFMKNLRDNEFFMSVDLVDTKQTASEMGAEAVDFELSAKRR